jgi:hypothetical protein
MSDAASSQTIRNLPRLRSFPCVAFAAAENWETVMMKQLLVAGCAILALAGATAAQATEKGVVGGAATGAIGGALVAGPVGAVVGGVGGAVVGNHVTNHPHRAWWRRHHHHHAVAPHSDH